MERKSSLRANHSAASAAAGIRAATWSKPQPQQAFMPEMAEFEQMEQQAPDAAQTQAMDQFLAAQNDPFRLMELAKDPSQPETLRRLSSEQAYRQLTNQREQEKAQEKINKLQQNQVNIIFSTDLIEINKMKLDKLIKYKIILKEYINKNYSNVISDDDLLIMYDIANSYVPTDCLNYPSIFQENEYNAVS